MDLAKRDRWVAALRSGKYVQTKSALHAVEADDFGNQPGYCCLGVLCDLAAQDGIVEERTVAKSGMRDQMFYDLVDTDERQTSGSPSSATMPTRGVRDWAGFTVDEQDRGIYELSRLNDEEDASFEEIADYIERNF